MLERKIGVFDENGLLFGSYNEFVESDLSLLKGKTLALINVEYRVYGVTIHQVNLITISVLTISDDGDIDLQDLVAATTNPETLLPEQKSLVYLWIMGFIPKDAWIRTLKTIKAPIS